MSPWTRHDVDIGGDTDTTTLEAALAYLVLAVDSVSYSTHHSQPPAADGLVV